MDRKFPNMFTPSQHWWLRLLQVWWLFSPCLGVHRLTSLPPYGLEDVDSSLLLGGLGWVAKIASLFRWLPWFSACLFIVTCSLLFNYLLLASLVSLLRMTISSCSMVADSVWGLHWLHVSIFCNSSCLPEWSQYMKGSGEEHSKWLPAGCNLKDRVDFWIRLDESASAFGDLLLAFLSFSSC